MSTLTLNLPLTSPQKPKGPAARISAWIERRQTRYALARLDAHLLADIGLAPQAAQHECGRLCWLS